MPGNQATLRWAAAKGPVTGYIVFSSRNGAESRGEIVVPGTEVTLTGATGDVVEVSVMAYGQASPTAGYTVGPRSAPSEPIVFGGTPAPPSGLAFLDCLTCGAIELRVLPSATTVLRIPHPTGGSWELVRFASLAPNVGLQGLLRERTTGALWIGDLTSKGLVFRATHVAPGFATRVPLRTADFDGDGVDEIVIRDFASGSTEIWGLAGNVLTLRATFSTWSRWTLIGTRDQDGDGFADLWFDDKAGSVRVLRIRNLTVAGAIAVPVALSGYSAYDVADYDGDGLPDVLWRGTAGELVVSLLRGTPAAPQVALLPIPALAGDEQLLPRGSVDLDAILGEEIVLQSASSGAVDLIQPEAATSAQRQRLLVLSPGWRLIQVER